MMLKKNFLILGLMLFSTYLAYVAKPNKKIADEMPAVSFETEVPKSFAGWESVEADSYIIDQQQQEMINKIYSQTLSRTYVNKDGYSVMLVIAYGAQQNDSNRLHYPEVCYPAQGFEIRAKVNDQISFPFGTLKIKKLLAKKGNRVEPITYWTILGDKVVRGSSELKLEQIRYGLQGKIPDGALIRVSSIDADLETAYKHQEQFIRDLSGAVKGSVGTHIMGNLQH